MKIGCILMTYNEEDIIKDILIQREGKFDITAILDSSNDKTSIIIRDFIKPDPHKYIYFWDPHPLENRYFRNKLLDMIRPFLGPDDWIFQVDADHVLHYAFKEMVCKADIEGANTIIADIAQFYYTFEDYKKGVTDWKELKYYSINWQLKIAYKNVPGLRMHGKNAETPSVPEQKNYSFRPVVKHFQWRSPEQIRKKVERSFGLGGYSHFVSKDWHDYIIDEKLLAPMAIGGYWVRGGYSWRTLVEKSKGERGDLDE